VDDAGGHPVDGQFPAAPADHEGKDAGFWDEAHALAGLGRCAVTNGHAAQAEILLQQALEIFQRIGAGEARDLLTEVNALTGPRPAGSTTKRNEA
jgi:hypothetical protein